MSSKPAPPADPTSVAVERIPGSQVSLSIEVPAEKVERTYERVLNRLSQRVKIEGFRPGKAPRAMVEARLGPDTLREEVVDTLAPEVIADAIEENSIPAISRPRLEVIEVERGKPARFVAKVDVVPEVELPDLGALKTRKSTTEVTDELVSRRVDDYLEKAAQIEPVERPVEVGDVAVVDLDVLVAGAELPEEKRRAMEVEVKEGVLIPELLQALPGAAVGETREATVKMPDDHSNPELAGKEAVLRMTVQGVKQKHVPELDDELAKQVSDGRYETAEALRTGAREELAVQAVRVDEMTFEQELVKEVVESSRLEVPHSLVDREIERRMAELERQLARQGLKLDLYFKYAGLTPEQWFENEHPDAEARLRVDLVLEEVAKQQGIEPTDEEVLAHMRSEVETDPDLKDRADEVAESESARRFFRHRLERLRTLERLKELAGGGAPKAAEEAAAEAAGGSNSAD